MDFTMICNTSAIMHYCCYVYVYMHYVCARAYVWIRMHNCTYLEGRRWRHLVFGRGMDCL